VPSKLERRLTKTSPNSKTGRKITSRSLDLAEKGYRTAS